MKSSKSSTRRKRSSKSSTRRKRSSKSSVRRKRSVRKRSSRKKVFKLDGGQTCVKCGSTGEKLLKCAKCKSVYYCNTNCQRAHWKVHKSSCVENKSIPLNEDSIKGDECEREIISKRATVECVVCFEDVGYNFFYVNPCCGAKICQPCLNKWAGEERKIEYDLIGKPINNKNCPMCRVLITDREHHFKMLQKNAGEGKGWANCELGLYYTLGPPLHRNYNEGLKNFLIADEQNILRALMSIGKLYQMKNQTNKAIEYLIKGSNSGIDKCSFDLASLFYKEGPSQNKENAIKYFKVAACQGSLKAKYNLSSFYMDGYESIPIDKTTGIKLLTEAADGGLQNAQYLIGSYYFKGEYVDKSIPSATEYLKKALTVFKQTEMGYYVNLKSILSEEERNNATFYLATCYFETSSFIDSYYWYKKHIQSHPNPCDRCPSDLNVLINQIKTNLEQSCCNCGKTKEKIKEETKDSFLMICSRCSVVYYCNIECQQKNRESHKEICDEIGKDKEKDILKRELQEAEVRKREIIEQVNSKRLQKKK